LKRSRVYVVGAGFSLYSGLPLQTDFTEALLGTTAETLGTFEPLVNHLRSFVHDVFDHNQSAHARFWPELEDLFTNIDQAANTGHHLGPEHSPSRLRTTRRVLLARIVAMLQERITEPASVGASSSKRLDEFFAAVDLKQSAFISMNWDTVVERRLSENRNVRNFDYGCGAIPARFPPAGHVVEQLYLSTASRFPLIKMHGSSNWLYCDNCRRLYWFSTRDGLRIAKQLISPAEGRDLGVSWLSDCGKWHCSECITVRLTTRVATFSYLKALDFPMFERSWLAAEALLNDADEWVFIGYSLPAADYEFKHLLKRVQLSRKSRVRFSVVTGGGDDAVLRTYRNYQGFFGRDIRRSGDSTNFFPSGLTQTVIKKIT